MRLPPRLVAALLFVGVGMLALVVAGVLDWIVGVLFLSMEFLGEVLRNVFRRKPERRPPPGRPRPGSTGGQHAIARHRASIPRRGRPRRKRPGTLDPQPPAPGSADPPFRVLVPLGADEPGLLEFALEECRLRHAELIVLFLRPMAVTPMGPVPLPGLAEDDEARAVLGRVADEAGRASVPLRTIYTATADRPATIGEVARACLADAVIVGSSRRKGLAQFLTRDPAASIARLLPERACLMIHAT